MDDEPSAQPVCSRCGHVEWQNPKPTASALITRYPPGRVPEVLLVRRGRPPAEGAWDIPGGFLDCDEHPEQAALREAAEELGVRVAVRRLVGIFTDRYGEDGDATLNLYYEAALVAGEVHPASDVASAAWFPLDALPEPLAFDNNRRALDALKAAIGLAEPTR